jgi:hypothetical protein
MVLDSGTAFQDQAIRIRAGARELSCWDIPMGEYRHCVSAPFRLPGGLNELVIESVNDSRSRDARRRMTGTRTPTKPHRLHIAGIRLSDGLDTAETLARDANGAVPIGRN